MRAALILLGLLPAFAGGAEVVSEGLAGAGRLPAGTIDFLGDTLGSFSSLQLEPGSWKRVGNHYEGVLWTLPDRGRNDPEAGLFFDYAARLERLRIRFTPGDGQLFLTPDGGLKLRDFRGQPLTGADPGPGSLMQRDVLLPAPASGNGSGKASLDAESLQFVPGGGFYIGDEYAANVYYFDRSGQLQGLIRAPRRHRATPQRPAGFRIAQGAADRPAQQPGRGRSLAVAGWPEAVRRHAERTDAGQRER